ncbi:60 kDa jasmonate-induced protein-like [Fagus crenata]|jgi:hypothetical protein
MAKKFTKPEFVADFEITKINPKVTYKKFIEDLRNNKNLGKTFSHNIPVLAPQEKTPTRWFHVVLKTDEKEITLSIRCDNLYLECYQMGKAGAWMEFGSDTKKPPSPSFLGFDGDYGDLEKAAGIASHLTRNSISLGQQALKGAVNALANSSTERQVRARSLIIVIRMICESIRFPRISDHIAKNFKNGFEPESWMSDLENNWSSLSADLLLLDASVDDHTVKIKFKDPENLPGIILRGEKSKKKIEEVRQALLKK